MLAEEVLGQGLVVIAGSLAGICAFITAIVIVLKRRRTDNPPTDPPTPRS